MKEIVEVEVTENDDGVVVRVVQGSMYEGVEVMMRVETTSEDTTGVVATLEALILLVRTRVVVGLDAAKAKSKQERVAREAKQKTSRDRGL